MDSCNWLVTKDERDLHKDLEMVKKMIVQQYSKKITHLSQQGYGKKKVQCRKNTSRKNTKKN